MKRASTCSARGRRSCCCRRERSPRDWPDLTETSSVARNVCRQVGTPLPPPTTGKATLFVPLKSLVFLRLSHQMILSWTGARLEGGQYEKANVNATDNHNSTCMHHAAAAGMKVCVEVREGARRSRPSPSAAVPGLLSVGSAEPFFFP